MANEAVSSAPKNDEVEEVETEEVEAEETDAEAEKALGDAGKQALDRTKAKWRVERDRAKALEAELAKLRKPVDKPADKAEDKPDLEALRKAAREEIYAESLKDRALDKVEAKAAKLFADPEDARTFLTAQADDFVTGGKVDIEAINEALADLLEKRPYLAAATQGDGKRFKGSADSGSRTGQPAQFTGEQVKKMTPDQIVDAQKKGLLDEYLAS